MGKLVHGRWLNFIRSPLVIRRSTQRLLWNWDVRPTQYFDPEKYLKTSKTHEKSTCRIH